MKIKLSLRTRLLLYMSIIYVSTFLFVIARINKMAFDDAHTITDSNAMKYSEMLQAKLNSYFDVCRALGQSFETYDSLPDLARRSAFMVMMKNILSQNEDYLSVWSLWEPMSIDNNDALYARKPASTVLGNFAPTFYKIDGKIKLELNTDTIESNLFTSSYYTIPKKRRQETILSPYYYSFTGDSADRILMSSMVYPIQKSGRFLGVVAIDVSFDKINQIVSSIKPYEGSHAFLVTDDSTIILDQDKAYDNQKLNKVYGNIQGSSIFQKIASGESVNFTGRDAALDEDVYYSIAPLKIGKTYQNWAVGIEVPSKVISSQTIKTFYLAMILGVIGLVLLLSFAYRIAQGITGPLEKTTVVLKKMALGDISSEKVEVVQTHDIVTEITQSVNSLIEGLNSTTAFAKEIGLGNLDAEFEMISEKDILGKALLDMRESLSTAKKYEEQRKWDDEKRNWSTNGIAKFGDILRHNNDKLNELCYDIISNLVDYLKANQGGIFMLNDDDPLDVYIELAASCAYNRRKYHTKRLELGDGLVGRCIQENETIYMTKVPEDYIEISSGLGYAKPTSLLLVPLKLNEKTYGIIEIASFNEIADYQIEFVEKLGENIASTISNVKINMNTAGLLEKFQQQAEAMKAQEEELRQNLEELQSTQEEMERIKQDELYKSRELMKSVEDNQKLMIDILDKVPANIFLKDDQGMYVIVNSSAAATFGKSIEEMLGSNDIDLYPFDEAKRIKEHDLEIISHGEQTSIKEETHKGETRFLKTTEMPFFVRTSGQNGVLTIQYDVSDVRALEAELIKQNKELKLTQESYMKEKNLMDALMNTIPDAIYFKDKQSKFIRLSKSLQDKHGTDILIGKSDFDFFSIEHAQQAYDDEQKIIATGKPIIDLIEKETFEDGHIEWVSTTKMPLRDMVGNIVGTFGISRLVSHLKMTELDGQQTKEILGYITETLPVLYYQINIDGIITQFTGEGLAAMNLKDVNMVGKNIFDLYPEYMLDIKKCQFDDLTSVSFTTTHDVEDGKVTFQHKMFKHKYIAASLVGFAYEV